MGKGPNLPDIGTIIQAGIDPKTGLPVRMKSPLKGSKEDIRLLLRNIDLQDHVNRFRWYNLPCDITGQDVERMLYYKGQLAFFYMEELDDFFFMPYALDGTIDFYGRFRRVHPIPFANGVEGAEKKISQAQRDLLSTIKLDVVYGIVDEDDVDYEKITKSCVLLRDRSRQLSETILPRTAIIESILDVESEYIPYMSTSLMLSSGVMGMRVQDADQENNALIASQSMKGAALRGEAYIPIIGQIDFQELTNGTVAKSAEYMMAMQSVDNFRLRTLGLKNGGLFEKQAHELQSENSLNASNADTILQDALAIRQQFCHIANSIWGTSIWVELSESVSEEDIDGDGMISDSDQEGLSTGMEGESENDGTI